MGGAGAVPRHPGDPLTIALPPPFAAWFVARGWRLRQHQAAMLEVAQEGRDALLIAPTGGGKTLGGFLPSLIELTECGSSGRLHTLYISPLKALTNDIARNLLRPVAEMGLTLRIETRTGDTPQNRRRRQREHPPDLLLTTPESLALLLSYPEAVPYFASLRCVVLDELHALAASKRGALLSLVLARLRRLAPQARFVGLSATVADPPQLARYLSPTPERVAVIAGGAGAEPEVRILVPEGPMPWAGHVALYAAPAIMREIGAARLALVFVNTRAQAELIFGALWRHNPANLPIGLHHGSLDVEQRRRIEAAMAAGALRAVVATASLDLGIDWGDVDLVLQVGAPKGIARLLQRIGRANHRLDEPSRAVLVPGNRFELLECLAAREALHARELDGGGIAPGGLDVLAQHVAGVACSGPFDADTLYAEVRTAAPFAALSRRDFDDVLDLVATGGYALRTYERYRRIERRDDGLWHLCDPRLARQHRMNVGTIVEAPVMRVRLGRKRLGEIEETFVAWLEPGDTFLFAGQLLRFEGIRDNEAIVSPAKDRSEPKVPTWAGSRYPLSTELAGRVRRILAAPATWRYLPAPVREWLEAQARHAVLPQAGELLVETFPRRGRHYLVAYSFAGYKAHQTLGMLLTRRMERRKLRPLGFVASDYCIAVWGLEPVDDVAALFDVDILGEDLEAWMAESSLIKRTFRNCAVVAGLIQRRHPGAEKTGRQVTFGADLIYDVLRKYEPDHVLLRAARAEAATGLTDIRRLADLLVAVEGRIRHVRLPRISPFAVAIIAGIGRELVAGDVLDQSLDEAVAELVAEAMAD
ncbi:ligase-associated DNA damage response DEXH box helicase [Benzoatithermus flavus]|uniref:Ligase-associated DNA damage response DEXH box helicase n=1 Tax=Benzoatithermus flavus TaxID=3108223 RepID=A0ABU8XTY5_9PROT